VTTRDDMSCYVVRPHDPSSSVVVLPELFGLTPHVLAVCDALAAEGHEVVCPDLYHHVPGAVVLPETDEGRDAGFRALAQRNPDDLVDDVAAACGLLANPLTSLGLVGLSVGGYIGFLAAARLGLARAALLYPGWLASPSPPVSGRLVALDEVDGVRGRLLVAVGEHDALILPPEQQLLEARLGGRGHRVHIVPGVAHGFLSPSRPSYDAAAARAVWGEVLVHVAPTT
jgi:carboxymethylenebutenolidase